MSNSARSGFRSRCSRTARSRSPGALGHEFPPDAVLASSSSTLLSAPQGMASVHSLIKTLFPAPANNSGVMIPLTTESQVLLSLPLPAGADSKIRPTLDAN